MSFEEEEWGCVRFAFCKDPIDNTKSMIPLEPYDEMIYDDKDETSDYKVCRKAMLRMVTKTGDRLRTLDGINKCAYKLLGPRGPCSWSAEQRNRGPQVPFYYRWENSLFFTPIILQSSS